MTEKHGTDFVQVLLPQLKPDFSNMRTFKDKLRVKVARFGTPGRVVANLAEAPLDVAEYLNKPVIYDTHVYEVTNRETGEVTEVTSKWSTDAKQQYREDMKEYKTNLKEWTQKNAEIYILLIESIHREVLVKLTQLPGEQMERIHTNADGVTLWFLIKMLAEEFGASNSVQKKQELNALRQTGQLVDIREFFKAFDELVLEIDAGVDTQSIMGNVEKIETLKRCLRYQDHKEYFFQTLWAPTSGSANYPEY